MGGIEIPADPAANGYVENPYTAEIAAAYEYVKRETDSEDGWTSIGTKQGVVMEKKTVAGDPSTVPLVRGKGTIKGVKVADFLPMVTHPGARKFWDARYLDGHALEKYSRRSYKFYSLQKGGFMVQPRDFVGAQDIFFEEDGTIYLTQCSVPNDEKTPDVSGKTRGTLTAAGWRLRPNGDDTDLSYIVKVNPNGSLPSAIVNIVVQEIPNCVVNVINWIGAEGLIPYVTSPSDPSSVFRLESYVHDKHREYALWLIAKGDEELELSIDDTLKYKNGYEVKVEGEAKDFVTLTEESASLKVKFSPEADGKKMEIIITAK